MSLCRVQSINWSGKTRWPGAISSFSEPTAVVAIIWVQPSSFKAQMFALLLTLVGTIWCFFPCRAKIATGMPFKVP